jgi:capsular polysaccharide biosynthesis protein
MAQIKSQIKEYGLRVEKTPQREQELLTLQRDYDNIKESYNSLLNRKLEAEISVNMEKKQKGEQFQIIDYAVLPKKPVSPDLKKLFLLSVAASLGLGAGLIFLIDFTNTALKDPRDYESQLGLAVLAVIPKLQSRRGKMWHWVNNALTTVGLAVAAGLAGAFGLVVLKGVEPMLKLVSQYVKI